jgi:hypothetical protein
MPRERSDIKAALTSKGFREQDRGGHDCYWLYLGETKQSVWTKLSRGTGHREIDDSLLSQMARQLQLTRGDFLDLVDCPLDGPGYIAKLRARGVNLEENQPLPAPQHARQQHGKRKKKKGK